jgi:hypothetical protein
MTQARTPALARDLLATPWGAVLHVPTSASVTAPYGDSAPSYEEVASQT